MENEFETWASQGVRNSQRISEPHSISEPHPLSFNLISSLLLHSGWCWQRGKAQVSCGLLSFPHYLMCQFPGYCNKFSHTWQLKITEIYSLLVLEAINPKSSVSRAALPLKFLGENLSLNLSFPEGGSRYFSVCGCRAPISAYVFIWPLPLCLYLLFLIRILVIGFRAHPGNPEPPPHLEPHNLSNLIISAKSLFPNKATFSLLPYKVILINSGDQEFYLFDNWELYLFDNQELYLFDLDISTTLDS